MNNKTCSIHPKIELEERLCVCHNCNGEGYVEEDDYGSPTSVFVKCHTCNGEGSFTDFICWKCEEEYENEYGV